MPYSEYKKTRGNKVREVALISGVDVTSFKQDVDEYTTFIREHGSLKYHFTEYNAQGSPQQLKDFAEEISQRNYALVFTYGRSATTTMQALTSLRKQTTPIIFAAMGHPAAEKLKSESNNVTGISVTDDPVKRLEIFLAIRESAQLTQKAIILLAPAVEKDEVARIHAFLIDKNVHYELLVCDSVRSVLSLLNSHKQEVDTLITLRDTFSSQIPEKVAQWCADTKVAYFSSVIHDVVGGACVAISRVKINMGERAARQTLAILDDHKSPEDIPVMNIGEDAPFEMHINISQLKEQDIPIDAIVTVALRYGVTWETEIGRNNP